MDKTAEPGTALLRPRGTLGPTVLQVLVSLVVMVATVATAPTGSTTFTVDSADSCRDEDLLSPVDLTQPLVYKDFGVGLQFKNLTEIPIRKQAKNLFKLESDFGVVSFAGSKYSVDRAFFRFPSEHKINGQRMPLELQMIGRDPSGAKIGLVVLYHVGTNLNYFLNEMSFGKGYLKELPISSQRDKKLYVAKTNMSFEKTFTNNGTWLMYEGSDTNAPCNSITWLISFDVAEVHPEQLMDVPVDSTPFFSTKPLKERVVYRNKHNYEELLEIIRKQEKQANEELKRKNQDDIKKEEARRLEALANAIEKAMDVETEEIKAAKQRLADEYKKANQVQEKKQEAAKTKIQKQKNDDALHQRAADLRYPTPLLYERILDKVKDFYKKEPICPDFLEYEPPKGKPWGYIPADVVMSWDINKFTNSNTTKVARPTIPAPKEKTLVYRPLFFQKKDVCGEPNALNMSIWAPVKYPDPIPLDSPLLTKLAQIDMMILDQKVKATPEVRTLIPVLVKTLPNITAPSAPVTMFTMLNGTELIESLPNTTGAIIQLPKEKITKVAPVTLVRDFADNPTGTADLQARRSRDVNNRPSVTGGYNIPPPKPPSSIVSPQTASMPNAFNVSWPANLQTVIWPAFRPESPEGTLPYDARFAWTALPESERVLNIPPPPSPSIHFRWLLLCWLQTLYAAGPDNKPLWVPVYILARSDFQWERKKVPDEIPVFGNRSVRLSFESRKAEDTFTEPRLLKPVKGVDPELAVLLVGRFRLNLEKQLNVRNPLYMKALEEKYHKMQGLISLRYEKRLDEATGILIDPDLVWRMQQEELEQQRIDEERKQAQAARQQRLQRIAGTPDHQVQRTVRYERVCLEYNLEVVVNRRGNNYVEGIFPPVFQICVRWGWKEYNDTITIPGVPPVQANVSTPSVPGQTPTPDINRTIPTPQIPTPDATSQEDKCKQYMQIVLNRRRVFFSDPYNDYMEKECFELFNALKKTRLQQFRGGLGPIMDVVKDTAVKSAQMLKNAREDAKRINKQESDARYKQGMGTNPKSQTSSPIKQLVLR